MINSSAQEKFSWEKQSDAQEEDFQISSNALDTSSQSATLQS